MDQPRQETLLRMHEFYADEARHQRQMMWDTAKWFTVVLTGLAGIWVTYYFDKFLGHSNSYTAWVLILIAGLGLLLSWTCLFLLRAFYTANIKYISMYAKAEDELQLEPRSRPDKEFFPGDKYLNWHQYVGDRMNNKDAEFLEEGYTSKDFLGNKMPDDFSGKLEKFYFRKKKVRKAQFTIYDLTKFVFCVFGLAFFLGVILAAIELT